MHRSLVSGYYDLVTLWVIILFSILFCFSHVINLKCLNSLPKEWLGIIFPVFKKFFFYVFFLNLLGKIEKDLKFVSENILLELPRCYRRDTHTFRLRTDVYFYLQLSGDREMCTQYRSVFPTKLLWLAGCLNY